MVLASSGSMVEFSTSRAEPSGAARSQRRVLLFRSCRMPQFTAAIDQVKTEHPSAECLVLTHEDFAAQVVAAGADGVIGHRATRLSIARLGPKLVMQLRRQKFDAVVVPLMEAQLRSAANLLRLAACVGAPTASIWVGGTAIYTVSPAALRRMAIAASLKCPETVVVLLQMAKAVLCRRPSRDATRGTRPIRVLHIINSLGMGGTQTQCAELVNRMPPGRFQVDMLVLANDSDFSRNRVHRPDVSIRYLDAAGPNLGTVVDAIAAHCRQGRYDVVHTWLPMANMVGAAAARLAGVPRIVTSVRSRNPGHFPQWRQWWHRIGDVLAARIADVVTVNARPLVRDHARWALMSPRRVHTVHNGLDPTAIREDVSAARASLRKTLALPAGTPLIGCVGRLAIEKDQATFIRALAVLRESGVRFHAVLVGDGPCEAALWQLTIDGRLNGIVSFLGARPDARRIIAGLDILALTSRIEGFPNVLLEAGFLGVPVVSTDVGGVLDVLGEREGVCPCGDFRAVAQALSSTLSDPKRAAERAARLRARCFEHFTADRMAGRWMALYTAGAA